VADREPLTASGRLTPVTPQAPRPPIDHALHDRLLVVRFASHEQLDPTETAAVHAQLDACPDCASLMVEIGVIARATASSQTPRRPRDFRISPEQAERLRGSWLQRLLGRFDGANTQLLRPLAGAVLAVGLVLTLVGTTLPGITSTRSTPTDLPRHSIATDSTGAGAEASGGSDAGAQGVSASGGPENMTYMQGVESPDGHGPVAPQTSINPKSDLRPQSSFGVTGQAPLPTGAIEARLSSPPPDASVGPNIADIRAVTSPEPTPEAVGLAPTVGSAANSSSVSEVTWLGFLLAIVGATVLGLVWLARRSNRDSLLR
jgi:hypothetical protein